MGPLALSRRDLWTTPSASQPLSWVGTILGVFGYQLSVIGQPQPTRLTVDSLSTVDSEPAPGQDPLPRRKHWPTGVCSTRCKSPQTSNQPESKSASKNPADRRLFTRCKSPQTSNQPESKSASKNPADRRLFHSVQITPKLQPTETPEASSNAAEALTDRRLFDSVQITPKLQPTRVEIGQKKTPPR